MIIISHDLMKKIACRIKAHAFKKIENPCIMVIGNYRTMFLYVRSAVYVLSAHKHIIMCGVEYKCLFIIC